MILATGMQLHRQDSHFKKCKPAMTNSRKTSQKINANKRISALRAERDLILSYLQGGSSRFATIAA
jgi:hypothetical protein